MASVVTLALLRAFGAPGLVPREEDPGPGMCTDGYIQLKPAFDPGALCVSADPGFTLYRSMGLLNINCSKI